MEIIVKFGGVALKVFEHSYEWKDETRAEDPLTISRTFSIVSILYFNTDRVICAIFNTRTATLTILISNRQEYKWVLGITASVRAYRGGYRRFRKDKSTRKSWCGFNLLVNKTLTSTIKKVGKGGVAS